MGHHHHTRGLTPCYACERLLSDPPTHPTLNSIISCKVAVFAPCFLQFINLTLDPAVLEKVKDSMCFLFSWGKKTPNYNKLYVSPHMSFLSAYIHHTLV